MDWESGGGLLGVWAFIEGVYGIQMVPKSLMGVGGYWNFTNNIGC